MDRVIIQPIHALALRDWDIGTFDLSLLPLQIVDGITLEDVRPLLTSERLSGYETIVGRDAARALESLQYGIVARFNLNDGGRSLHSDLAIVTAALRIIRPMREELSTISGVSDHGSFSVTQLERPTNLVNVHDIESLFSLRTEDALSLSALAPAMLEGMRGSAWKFRMAVQFNDAAHLQNGQWKPRFMLRCSALEALFSSKLKRGTNVSKMRIRSFLGDATALYSPGDLPDCLDQSAEITVGSVLDDLYEVRNYVSHGEKIPDSFFNQHARRGLQGSLNRMALLDEAASLLVRKSLRKILADGLFEHFIDGQSVDRFFAENYRRVEGHERDYFGCIIRTMICESSCGVS